MQLFPWFQSTVLHDLCFLLRSCMRTAKTEFVFMVVFHPRAPQEVAYIRIAFFNPFSSTSLSNDSGNISILLCEQLHSCV